MVTNLKHDAPVSGEKDEPLRRLLKRLDEPEKNWKSEGRTGGTCLMSRRGGRVQPPP